MNSPFFLAPMAGYTDYVFRDLCISYGAGLTFTEMVSAEGLARDSKNTVGLLRRGSNEKVLAVQIFSPNAETTKRCIPNLLKFKPDLIDLNCGCPVPKIIKTGCGSALLKEPKVIGEIVKVLCEETNIPISVKIRSGWDDENINYLSTAEQAFKNGAYSVCLHARTKVQLYMPYANWAYIKDLKAHFPEKHVVGNGDVFTSLDAVNMLKETKVDAVMIARGAMGNPFIFREANMLLSNPNTVLEKPSIIEIKNTALMHLKGLISLFGNTKEGEITACKEMRKHISHYFKGITNSNKIRNSCYNALTFKEYEEIINSTHLSY